MARGRRLRGALLRLVRNRRAAVAAGAVVAAPAVLLLAADYHWETGASDGLALILLATGAALAWSGIAGPRPDWFGE